MKSLKVRLSYSSSQAFAGFSRESLALPVRVVDADGGVVAEGATSDVKPLDLTIPDEADFAFVRLTWPSGRIETQRVDFKHDPNAVVTFEDSAIGHSEWSAWAVPRLNSQSPLSASTGISSTASGVLPTGMEAYHRAWLRLWKFVGGVWSEVPVKARRQRRSDAAFQFDFDLAENSWLLQFGGTKVPWTFVSLPGGGPCRVLLTPNSSRDRRADPLRAVVTGFRSNTEALLEFLSRDSIRAASALAQYETLAERLLSQKADDPIAAVAGGYYLLRTRGWSDVPVEWFERLYSSFPWIPDAAVIRCAVIVRSGLESKKHASKARRTLKEAVRRGIPIFAEGLALLQETAAVLRHHRRSSEVDVFATIERLAASQAWAGASLSYYGRDPHAPSPEKAYGYPGGSITRKSTGRSSASSKTSKAGKLLRRTKTKASPESDSFVLLRDIVDTTQN